MGRKGRELEMHMKNITVGLLQSGYSRRNITSMLKIPKSTVIGIIRKFSTTSPVGNKPRSDRQVSVSERDYRILERIVHLNRRSSLSEITQNLMQQEPSDIKTDNSVPFAHARFS